MDYFKKLIFESLIMESVADVSDVNDAINNLTQVEIRYMTGGKNIATGRRIIYPVAYGLTKSGNPVVRAFEPYGDTSSKVPAWKFFRLDRIKNWRPLKKTFNGEKLEGFNENGDETMSIVYNIANIGGRPQKIIFPKPTSGPVKKSDITPNANQNNTTSNLSQGEKYGAEDIVKDLMQYVPQDSDPLNGIKQQLNGPKQMVSPDMLKQIEKDNARRKLSQAKKQGITLDNEEELNNIVKGIMNNSASLDNNNERGIVKAGTGPITKDSINNDGYEITNDDLQKIKQRWGLK